MINIESMEPLILRPEEGEYFRIWKTKARGRYVIVAERTSDEKLNGKLLIDPNVEPVLLAETGGDEK